MARRGEPRRRARLVAQHHRKTDRLSRCGGEEFLILAPETASAQARQLAARLNRILEDHDFERMGKLTASFGVAAYRAKDTPQTLLKRVDEALYRAKENGRNRVETSP